MPTRIHYEIVDCRALRPISERKDEAGEQQVDVGILEDSIEELDPFPTGYSQVLEGIRQHEERGEKVSLKNSTQIQ